MPTTTTGIATEFITFSRPGATGGGATVTDSDGLIKWAPHNLLLNSESFDTTSWSKTTTTVAANSIAAPNGTTTADTLTAAGANSTTLQSYTALAVPYTFGVWLRRKTGTGNIQIAADSGTYTTVTITSSWALYTVSQTPAAGTISAGIRIVTSADEVYAWGAALYRSDLAMQPNTSAYPFYNPTTPKNLAGFTEDFSNAAWTASDVQAFGSGSTANAAIAPNGLQTADLLTETSTTAVHVVYQSVNLTTGGVLYTLSAYFKANTRTSAMLRVGGGGYSTDAPAVRFLLSGSGTATTLSTGSTVISSSITPAADGWYRCSVTFTSGSAASHAINIGPHDGSASISYAGTAGFGIYIWGAQLSDSASLDTYAPVYGAAVTSAAYYGPRRDFNASTLACNGLLVEEQRTNLWTNSNNFSAGSWVTSSATPTLNNAISPDGTMNAALITLSGAGGDQYIGGYETLTGTYTSSFWIKASDAGQVGKTIRFDTTGAGSASSTITLTASWQRITITNAPTGYFQVRLISASGFTASAFHLYGGQLEAGSFATSYIPTGSTGATRTADVASVSTQAFPYSASASSVVVSAVSLANQYSNILELSASASAFGLLVFQNLGSISAYVDASSVSLGGATAGTVQKVGIAYDGSANGAVKNGGTVSSVGTTVSAPANKLGIGSSFAGGSIFSGYIRQITYLPRRISNAELITRTS